MKQLLSDLVKNWWTNPLPVIKNRDVDLVSYFDRNIRKIISVVGFRRVGKTFTLLDFAQKYGKEKCVYINFEDERVPKKTEVLSQLVDLLTELKANQPFVLLMDEIQEIPDWSLWARRINETTQHRLILSGSSSKLSSREIPTELRGQTITVPMFPLNWSEFLRFRNADINTLSHAHVLNLLREYLQFGGLPEIVLAEEGLRPLILVDYLSSFVDRDIVERYKLRKKEAFTDLLRLLPNTKSYTYTKLANSLKGVGHTVSKSTVIRYMQWLESSFFLSRVEVFSSNVKSRIQTVKKSYLVDNYFSSHFTSTLSPNFGHLMEQAVFHALHRRGVWDPRYGLTYWKDYSGNEVDFVVLHNKKVEELIQVTFASSMTEVSERETKALVKAAKALKKPSGMLITWDVEQTTTIDGIEVKYTPLWKWLATATSSTKSINILADKMRELTGQVLEGIEFLKKKEKLKNLRYSDRVGELEKIIKEFSHTGNLNILNRALHIYRSTNIAVPEGEDAFETTIWNTELHVRGKATTLEYILDDLEDKFREAYNRQ
ncbi:MAG: ATP-binding protein [Candidatus Omnitrophica bacterium]|nr:ATP-binding protein [Candidatus Omnitrophota bacterium]